MIVLLAILSVAAEWLIYIPGFWAQRVWYVGMPVVLVSFSSTALLMNDLSPATVICAGIALFRLVNLFRIAYARMHENYLLQKTRRTGFILGSVYLIALFIVQNFAFSIQGVAKWLPWLQVLAAAAMLFFVVENLLKSRFVKSTEGIPDADLPTVTVAIPARNETPELQQCLQSIIDNDYPKLEILVLDDCSHDRTPEIIRSFAHDGVRFVKGVEPQEHWLARNQAYEKLLQESTGEFVMFCGVDTRLDKTSIRTLVLSLVEGNFEMVSVWPIRNNPQRTVLLLFQVLRAWWEFGLPRSRFGRQPVSSACWIVNRETLMRLGGFKSVRHTILLEAYFARELAKAGKYSFLRANHKLGISEAKNANSIFESAIRTRYPQLRRRLEMSVIVAFLEFVFFILPFIVLAATLMHEQRPVPIIPSMVTIVLLLITHALIHATTSKISIKTIIMLLSLPISALIDIGIIFISTYKFEFSTIEWKGRNICIPVMHVVPTLPRISDK
ncbi:glycosyltransferase family 2 protein [Candidatus Saccharibacteria bacterium]|nr:glycosyltransferase family 2 protein [Candidatus Saccharibacteria bacterium]